MSFDGTCYEEPAPALAPFAARLASFDACRDAVEWCADRHFDEAWAECERADWLVWLALRVRAIGERQGRELVLELARTVSGRAPQMHRRILLEIEDWRLSEHGIRYVDFLLKRLRKETGEVRLAFGRADERRTRALEEAAFTVNFYMADRAAVDDEVREATTAYRRSCRRLGAALAIQYAANRVSLAACCAGARGPIERARWLVGNRARQTIGLCAAAAETASLGPDESRLLADVVRRHVPLVAMRRGLEGSP